MITMYVSMKNSVPMTRSDQTQRACFAHREAAERAETASFPGLAARDHSALLGPVLAIARL